MVAFLRNLQRRSIFPTMIIIVGTLLSVAAFVIVNELDRSRIQLEFKNVTGERYLSLNREIETSLQVLIAMDGFYDASDFVNRNEFRSFTKPFLQKHKSIQALEWIPLVPDSKRNEYEYKARLEGFHSFLFTERKSQGKMVKSSQRDQYLPVYYIEPYKGNEIALGFDLSSNPTRKLTLEQARDTGIPQATARIKLVQEKGDQSGIITCAPVYNKGSNLNTIQARRENLMGYVMGVFRVGNIVEASIAYLNPESIEMYIYDRSSPNDQSLLYYHSPRKIVPKMPLALIHFDDKALHLKNTVTIDVMGRKWEVICRATPDFIADRYSWLPLFVFAGGLLMTTLVAGYFFTSARRTRYIENRNKELNKAYDDLKMAQMQMLQQEKMASIGQLAAGIAHEINNPIGFISSNLGTLSKYTDKLMQFFSDVNILLKRIEDGSIRSELDEKYKISKIDYIAGDIKDLISESKDGADRVKNIVQDLKRFSHVDQAEYKSADLNECLESTVNMIWNELKYKATIKKAYGEIPRINCYPQQLNQVFMNILINAAHAIEKQGVIAVKTWHDGSAVFISISDTGSGMTPDVLNHIFEPFFTTKEVGKGTGLGLSITYDIIKKHGGDISVQSEAGVGTTFVILIPIKNKEVGGSGE